MITGAVMTILIGRFSDIFGARKMLLLMMVIYTAATAAAGFARDIATLLTIRAIQGIAIANTPIALKIIRDQFPKGKFSIGQSIVTSAYSGGMAIGVVLGPIIVATIGWQSIFFRGAALQGSGLGLDPDLVGLLQLPLSLTVLIFGPVFGLLLAKKRIKS
jgi:MFS family permease